MSTPLDAMVDLFDERYYRDTYTDLPEGIDSLKHYCRVGWREGRDPAAWFSTRLYLVGNLDVACQGINPFFHYVAIGRTQQRRIWPCILDARIPNLPPEAHIVDAEFDRGFYLSRHPDVSLDGNDPLVHFHHAGWKEGRDPAPWFATRPYLTRHADVARAGVDPFLHYVLVGREEGREIRPASLIHGKLDHVHADRRGILHVIGWQFPPADRIDILVDGRPVGVAQTNFARPDVQKAQPGSPARSGFRFRQQCDLAGQHVVTARMLSPDGAAFELSQTVTIEPATIEPGAVIAPAVAPSAVPSEQAFRVEIDRPLVTNGVAGPITNRLTVEGWAVARAGVASVDILLNGTRLGEAQFGLVRQDVDAALPDWPDALRSGFAFHCPPRALRNGDHAVELIVRAKDGQTSSRRFTLNVDKTEADTESRLRGRMPRVELEVAEAMLGAPDRRPAFHLFLHVPATASPEQLGATLESLQAQVYRKWDLTIIVAVAQLSMTRGVLAAMPDIDARAVLRRPGQARFDAQADLITVARAGDRFACDALLEVAVARTLAPADFLYTDDLRTSPTSHEVEPFCKPDFSPDLLLSTDYVGRAWFAAPALLSRARITPGGLLDHGGYDAVLRLTERARTIRHLPKLLSQAAPQPLVEQDARAALERAALERAARRRGVPAEVMEGRAPGTWRLRRTAPAGGKVSIIIPTCAAKGHIRTCITSLRERTAYRNIEIICVENIPATEPEWRAWVHEHADKALTMTEPFNWSRFNNLAVDRADGEFLLFLNDDVEVIQPDWLDAMLEHAQRPEVAAVGPQLLYPNGRVQHAGMFLAEPGTGRHAFRFAERDDPGYFGLALTQRNVIAVTGACMLMRRDSFDALGGFDETHDIINNDLDFCLRAHAAGQLVVFTPFATLIHHELASRDRLPDRYDTAYFQQRWGTRFAAGDPYFNPLLSRRADGYDPDDEPVEAVYAGHLFRAEDIRRILVVKLDHIGDFITAIPAIRRLKQHFPAASIHVLTSPANRALVETEPSVDGVIEFRFFHTRSELGLAPASDAALAELRARLLRHRFDLAVDMRKQVDTRDILRHAGATVLAGFDHGGRFPFLDIALEWETDRALQGKRHHASYDLVRLVDAIAAAGDAEHTNFLLQPAGRNAALDFLPADVRPLFARPVVVIHPGAGAVTKQWPAENFAAVVNMLSARQAINALLIGAPGEEPMVDAVRAAVCDRVTVGSLAGRMALQDLPGLFEKCALYIGNDSGPKHIAAAVGLPTIGIHSGTVDPTEWAPLGRTAVALRRAMHCSPCYLAHSEDCPRDLACIRQLHPDAVLPIAERFLHLRTNRGN